MKIKRGVRGGFYLVFDDPDAAYRYWWLFGRILRRRMACYGAFDNAYHLFGGSL